MKKSQWKFDAVAAAHHQGRRRAGGRHRRAGVSAHPLGLCRLSGPPGQDRGGQYAGRAVRHRRPHRRRRARAIDRQDLHHREPRRRRRQYRHGLCRARPTPDGYTLLLATNAYSVNATLYNKMPYDPHKDFVGVSELATSPNTFVVKAELPAKNDEGIRRARPGQPGQVQLRDAADRHDAADPARGAEDPREAAQAGRRRVQGRRRRAAGAAQRHRAIELRLAAAGGAAHQGRHAALPGGDRRKPLARPARCADHGGGRLQGFRVRHRHRAAGAGQDAARGRQVAGARNAQGALHAGDEGETVQGRLPGAAEGRRCRLGARHQGNRPCSRTSSKQAGIRRFSSMPFDDGRTP